MIRNIYAVLVGIDEYDPASGVRNLQGCVRDIGMVQEYLESRIPPEQLHLLPPLLNERATRQAVIDAFRNHLGQASSEDTVLFYYAGHGSQEDSPEEFWTIEPDRLNETLVCYDSRTAQGLELADKELATLIAEVAQKNPHIVLILDCCHSGSGTRDPLQEAEERRLPKSEQRRSIGSYLFSADAMDNLKSASRSPDDNPTGWSLSRSRHIMLAACRDYETAKEHPTEGGQKRGVFSRFLIEALSQANGNLSYRDLFQQTNALVRSNIANQSPQMEATIAEDLDLPFLGTGAIAPRESYFTVSHQEELGWVVNGGAVHGIAPPTGEEITLLALSPFSVAGQSIRDAAPTHQTIGTAAVVEVRPQLSKVMLKGLENFDPKTVFKAVVISQPLPPMGVSLIANSPDDEVGINLVRNAIQGAGAGQLPSLYVAEEPNAAQAEFRLLAKGGEYLVTRPIDNRPLITQLRGYTPTNAAEIVKSLEHMARWLKVVSLQSPISSLSSGALQIQVLQGEGDQDSAAVITEPQMRLAYQSIGGEWKKPRFRVKLTNQSQKILFCALFDLTERFAIKSILPEGTVRLVPGETAWVNDGKPMFGEVPDALWQQGITEFKDILKGIACLSDFDSTLMEQGNLGKPLPPADRSPTRGTGTLNQLMKRIITRDISTAEEESYDDWITNQVTFTFVRPQEAAVITPETIADLGMGVALQPHPTLRANARLTSANQSTRDLGNHMAPPILQTDAAIAQPFQFTNSRGTDPGLSVLELTQVDERTRQTVTPETPLKLTVAGASLQTGEQLLAIAYDGEFYLPVGFGQNRDQQLEINLQHLPESVSEGERSLQGAIRIFFQKVISKRLKLDFQYPLLSAVNFRNETVDSYDTVVTSLKERVRQANRIVLFIHGIIGDTESMVPSVYQAKISVDGRSLPLGDPKVYDLVLAFDYENLNTSVTENARLLKHRLEAVGLGEDHGKTLHIVAHSMGGLVARWFIEQEGGQKIVNHLIMLGTPNNGSPWTNVVDFALPLLTIGLNGLATLTWTISAIGVLARLAGAATAGIERQMTTALKEMQPNSTLINTLFSSPSPNTPYTIIAGNTSIIQPQDPDAQRKIKALLDRVGKFVVESPFMGMANDIAVTVDSITHLRDRSPNPRIVQVACDHLTYFVHPAGLAALAEAVERALSSAPPLPVSEQPNPLATISDPPPARHPLPVAEFPTEPASSQRVADGEWIKFLAIAAAMIAAALLLIWQMSHRKNTTQQNTSGLFPQENRLIR
jgi:pimeloyl-ACP methyl ester carboxylesterase